MFEAIKRLVLADRRAFAVVVVLYVLAAGAGAALPVMLGEVIDGIGTGWTASRVDLVCGAIVACVVLQLVLLRTGRRLGYRLGERAAARLRESFIDRVLRLPLGTVERAGTGDLATRTAGDVGAVAELLRKTAPEVAVAMIEGTVIIVAAFVVNWKLGLLFLVGMPMLVFAARRYLRLASPVFLSERAAMSEIAETTTASAAGSQTVAAYRMQAERGEAGYARAATHMDRLRGIIRLQTWFFPATDLTFLTPAVVVTVVGGLWYLDGAVTVGEVVAVAMLTLRLDGPVFRSMLSLSEFQMGGAAMARVEGVHLMPDEVRDAVPSGAEVRLDDVTFGYGDGPDVLHGLSLHPRRGERLVVVGPSGAGKSTIARLIAGIDRPRAGSVTLGGAPVADVPLEVLRRKVVLVTQEHYIFTASLRENLNLAAPEAGDEALLGALAAVDARWAADLPEGLDTMLGEEHHRLNLAEAQQLALARVILADPDVVILDEATAGIDPGSAGNVEASLAAALDGRTVIAIAHQLQAAESADRIAVVQDGRIVEEGSHAELLESGGAYASLWGAWKGVAV
ncbi:ABC transporter ATP-binding protein/permease [Glycomyces sp. TRM65418]|uniref:ABC transporter ATP-binding protein n=1 Tax=Glycomyces sp. TRM65418 TaxID=2867006 RepID=UPI001CE55ABB|nr:ABC transporter ATP-binding protein [Glycomyces sp. TRM65418]MCC3763812.1 ABC transporter ATP-binding protein/permease [Glycomyces sp. TRM65418]QZD53520.1 ABC transporter ATP-binding protein/permease [Glycomyces sp. TRM65418]